MSFPLTSGVSSAVAVSAVYPSSLEAIQSIEEKCCKLLLDLILSGNPLARKQPNSSQKESVGACMCSLIQKWFPSR
ncbi:hypothetical protein OROGR_009271 [Orobanche gracilis]